MPCDKSSAKRQNERQSSIDVASNAPPKSPVSSSQDEVAPHIILRSPRPQLGEFVPRAAKRPLQHGVIPESSHLLEGAIHDVTGLLVRLNVPGGIIRRDCQVWRKAGIEDGR